MVALTGRGAVQSPEKCESKEKVSQAVTNAALRGKPDAGNPHVRFDEGKVALAATPRRGSRFYDAKFSFALIAGVDIAQSLAGRLDDTFFTNQGESV